MLLYVEPLLYLCEKVPKRAGVSLSSRLVCMPRHSWETNQPPILIFSPPSLFCFMSNQACMYSLQAESQAPYSPPVYSTGSLTSQGDLSSLCQDVLNSWGWDAQYVTQTVHSLGKISACVKLLLFWSPWGSYPLMLLFLSAQFSIDAQLCLCKSHWVSR